MKSLTFNEIYLDLKDIENNYIQELLEKIIEKDEKYVSNFNRLFAKITDGAYLAIKELFREFALDFIAYNKEFQAKKSLMYYAKKFSNEDCQFKCFSRISVVNDFIKIVKNDKNFLDNNCNEGIKTLAQIIDKQKTNYKFETLRELKNYYNNKAYALLKTFNIKGYRIHSFRFFAPFELLIITF